MYNVYNKSEVYYFWDIDAQKKYLIGNEKELIHWLAKQYQRDWWCGSELKNDTLDSFACNSNDYLNYGKNCQILDGFDRCINPKIYEREARLLYLNYYKNQWVKSNYFYRYKNEIKYAFRYDPIPYTHKYGSGGPHVRPRRIKPLKKMYYAYPEYKEFNRGSHKDVPDGWWDDWHRCRQKNWKSQSKRRHQWKEKEVEWGTQNSNT